MTFRPESYQTGAAVSRVSSITLILLVLASIGLIIYSEKKTKDE